MNRLNISTVLRIIWKDIKILLKERGTMLYLFLIPFLFILAFGAAASAERGPQEEAVALPVVNLDAGSEASQTLLEALDQGSGIQCALYDEAQAMNLLNKGKINRVLTIPASYGKNLEAGRSVMLHLVNGPDANPARSEAVYKVVTGVAADLSLESQLISSLRQMADMQAGASQEQQVFTAEAIVEQAQSQFARSRTQPLLGLEENWPQRLLEKAKQDINPLSVYVPGFTVLFIFLTAQTTAQSIYEEKKVGSFRRLLAAPISKPSILLGKMVPNFITGSAQIITLFGAGIFVFPLFGIGGISPGNDPLALGLVCLVMLLCSTSLGVLIAAVARTESQISGIGSVVLWAFGFVGIWQAQLPSTSFFHSITRFIPHWWANKAFLDLLIRGQDLVDVVPSILPLLGFTAVFLVIGLWRFDFD
jgi:ABC-2 type transport system permease protein